MNKEEMQAWANEQIKRGRALLSWVVHRLCDGNVEKGKKVHAEMVRLLGWGNLPEVSPFDPVYLVMDDLAYRIRYRKRYENSMGK